MNNKKGFAIAGVLYPILILFLALMALLLMNLTQENYRLRKSVKDLTSKINGEEPKDAFKQKVEDIINCNGVENCAPSCTNFGLYDGAMSPSYGYTGDTSDLNGRFYKMMDGRTGVLIDDGTYCAYKTTGMQKLAVGEGQECKNAILDDTGTGIGLICPTDEELEAACNNTINSLKATIASASASAGDVLTGKTYVKPDATIGTGTMPNKGAITGSVGVGGTYSSTQNGYVTTISVTGPTLSGNAGTGDVLSGKTFYSNSGTKQTGTMPNLTSSSQYQHASNNGTKTLLADASFYTTLYNSSTSKDVGKYISFRWNGQSLANSTTVGNGYITTNTLFTRPASDFGNATTGNVLSGTTFTSASGLNISGTMTNRGAWTGSRTSKGTVTIPAGYHNGKGYVNCNYNGDVTHSIRIAFYGKDGDTNKCILYIDGSSVGSVDCEGWSRSGI